MFRVQWVRVSLVLGVCSGAIGCSDKGSCISIGTGECPEDEEDEGDGGAASGTCGTDKCFDEVGAIPTGYSFEDTTYACQPDHVESAFYVNASSFHDHVTNNGTSVSSDEVETAFNAAVYAWVPAGSGVGLSLGPARDDLKAAASEGDEQLVFWKGGDNPLEGVDTGAEFTCYPRTGADESCAHDECDIWFYGEIDGAPIPWSIASSLSSGYAGWNHTVMHEIGHSLGLQHCACRKPGQG